MLTIEQVSKKLKGKNYSEVAKCAGVTRSYVHAIANGLKENPSYDVVFRIWQCLEDGKCNG
jgi:transcriptional regulator with XRE-family HTH domain